MWPHGRRECAHDSLVDPRSGLQSSRQNDPAFGTVQLYRFAEQSAVERRMKPWNEGFGGDEAGRINALHFYSHLFTQEFQPAGNAGKNRASGARDKAGNQQPHEVAAKQRN